MGILAIEDALISKIKTVLGFPAAPKVNKVASMPMDINDLELLRAIAIQTPGVYVSFGGGTPPTKPGGTTAQVMGRWGVFVATGHASGQEARRRGDAKQAGAYELIEVLIPSLHGFTIAEHGTLLLVAVENLFSGEIDKRGITIYSAVFQMPMAWPSDADLSLLDSFQTFDAQYDIPTHETGAEHQKWLDGDYTTSRPDAEDTVNVPQ